MDAAEILTQLRVHGIGVRTDGERLFCSPGEWLTDELRAVIRANKAEILKAMRESLISCPLWQAGLICHVHSEGRCNHEPSACSVANGMRNYIHKHRMILTVEGKESS